MTGQSETKRQPLPLEVGGRNGYGAHNGVCIRDSWGLVAAVAIGDVPDLDAEANAARIVLTWNCHDELVAALTKARAAFRKYEMDVDADAPSHHREMMAEIEAALAKAASPTP